MTLSIKANIISFISLFLFIGTFLSMVHSQSDVVFDHITTQHGLSQSDINTIYQDKQGFMWFGTHDGLNKYDGYDFTIYKTGINSLDNIQSNLIFAIVGDDKGNLWIGTTGDGLIFFERSTEKFTQFKNIKNDKQSLSNDYVTELFLDQKNRLWIGTNNGLNMLNLNLETKKKVFNQFNPEQDPFITGWDGNSIFTIYEDSKNQLWVGGHGGLYILSRDKTGSNYFKRVNKFSDLKPRTVRCIGEDNLGRLIIGTNTGLFLQSSKKKKSFLNKISSSSVNEVQVDDKNNIWVGTNNGIIYFENSTIDNLPKRTHHFKHNPQNKNSLNKNSIKSLFIDKTGIIWVGTQGGGINKFDPERKKFQHIKNTVYQNSLSYNSVRSMFEDSMGNLWIGTDGGGLNLQLKENDNGNYNEFQVFKNIKNAFSLAEIEKDNEKILLIGRESTPGLFELNITDINNIDPLSIKSFPEINNSVFSLLRDSNNNIWIGTYDGGLYRWKPTKDKKGYIKDIFINDPNNDKSISNNIIRYIYEDHQGNIWIATGNGLNKISKKQKLKKNPAFEVYHHKHQNPESISHNYILSIFQSEDKNLWIGTFGGGLNRLIPNPEKGKTKFKSYTVKDGLSNDVIKGILEDSNNNLWLSTNKGLSKFNPLKIEFKNYDVNDGLQNNEFQELAILKRKNGELLFGGVNGITSFFSENIKENTYKSETILTNFLISNEKVEIGKEINKVVILEKTINQTKNINLKHNDNNFSFEFAALHYAAPSKNKFAYMLEGFDKNWIYTSSKKRFANYTNLSPGDYTFKVKATNNDGLWDLTPSKVNINISPPWWNTGLAVILYSLIAVGLLLLFWKYTFIRTEKKHRFELEHIENEKNDELQKIKLEFFTNISHEFRTPLTLIKGPLEYLQESGDAINNQEAQEQYTLMHKNTNYLLRLVNQLLDFRKINQNKMRLVVRPTNIVAFINEVSEPFQFLSHKKNISFNVNASKDFQAWFDHDAMEKIINNLLSNAFKYTLENGEIEVEITNEQATPFDLVSIKIKDTGTGIPKDKIKNVFKRYYRDNNEKSNLNPEGMGIGLAFTKSLVELHQGSINVRNRSKKGTIFTIKLPVAKEAYLNINEITCKEASENDFLVRSSETESFSIGINDELEDAEISKNRPKLPVLLVIDDNPDIRSFIKNVLKKDYIIYEAENGKEGLDMSLKILPNIVICDVLMPVMNGIKFCNELKNREETSHIPIILLTAKSSEESKLEGLKTGADDYLTKPFNMEFLKLKLANTIFHREEIRKQFNRNINLQPGEIAVTTMDEKFLTQAIAIVEKHMMNTDFNVEMLVKEMGLSRSNLYLKFKELTGLSSSEFIRNVRLKRAVQLFEKSDLSVKEIMYMTGFNTASYFSKCFKKQFGVVPSEYVKEMSNKPETETETETKQS